MQDTERFLLQLLELTQKLCGAFTNQDLDEAGRILNRRGELIECAPPFTPGEVRPELAQQILTLDEEAHRLARTFGGEIERKMGDSTRMNRGLMRYQQTRGDLSSGQIVDKKR